MARKTLIMLADDVESCIDLSEVFEVVKRVFRYSSEGQIILHPKLIMNIPADGHKNYIIAGPASVWTALLPLDTFTGKIIRYNGFFSWYYNI